MPAVMRVCCIAVVLPSYIRLRHTILETWEQQKVNILNGAKLIVALACRSSGRVVMPSEVRRQGK